MTTTKTPETLCPVCGKKLNSLSGIGHKEKPNPGDGTICICCASFLIIKNDLTVRLMSEEEIGELDDENRRKLIIIRKTIEELREQE